MNNENTEELSLYKVWISVRSKIPVIILCGIVAFVITFGIVKIIPEKHSASATVRLNRIDGVSSRSLQEIYYYFSNEKLLESYADETHNVKKLKSTLNISAIGGSFLEFHVAEVKDPEFWIDMINDMVDIINEKVSNEYEEAAQNSLLMLNNEIDEISNDINDNEIKILYNNLLLQRVSLKMEIEEFEGALEFVTNPTIINNYNSKSKLYILGAFIGCFISFIYFLLRGLKNNRLLMSSEVKHFVKNGELILTIPEYKTIDDFDLRYIEYLKGLLKQKEENILITSISEDAGVTTISNRLKDLVSSERKIFVAEAFKNKPLSVEEVEKADRLIIVLRSNIDTISDLRLLDKMLIDMGICNVSYIFNGALNNDSNIIKYV